MDDFQSYKKDLYDYRYPSHSRREKYNRYEYKEPNHEQQYAKRFEREHYQISQSTLCVSQPCKSPSKSTLCMPFNHRSPSKSTLCYPKKYAKPMMDDDVSSLPYYIVPVIYVPHKAMYEAKQLLEPKVYKAYHCRSKNTLHKDIKYPAKVSRSKSVLNLQNKTHRKEREFSFVPKNDKYSFECYDEYFRRYIEEKKSSSEISFCTDKSYCNLPLTPKLSSKFTDEPYNPPFEKRKSICKDFPELFGIGSACTYRPRTEEEEPTWDSPRTTDALIETEMAANASISAQTSFETLKWHRKVRDEGRETLGTQTDIKDIKKNVLVLPSDKFKRSIRRDPIPEEVPRKIYDGKVLNVKFSEGQLDKTTRRPFGFNRSSPRFARSAVSNSYAPSLRSSRRSIGSENASVN